MCDPRYKILKEYSAWTVLSALRRGPIAVRSKKAVDSMLLRINFEPLLDKVLGPITPDEFGNWHRKSVETLVGEDVLQRQFGWAAKIINVYLKTFAYVGDAGRPGLRECLHPPIDQKLWQGVRTRFGTIADIHSVRTIKGIDSFDCYMRIIHGLERLAKDKLQCLLIEVEQLWE